MKGRKKGRPIRLRSGPLPKKGQRRRPALDSGEIIGKLAIPAATAAARCGWPKPVPPKNGPHHRVMREVEPSLDNLSGIKEMEVSRVKMTQQLA